MSKEPTSKGRLDTGDEAGARRRRRRRGGGLRVPSDKVPRATTNREAELVDPPEPPEPEAPELAVSVADAFGDDSGGAAGSAPEGERGEAVAEREPDEPEDGAEAVADAEARDEAGGGDGDGDGDGDGADAADEDEAGEDGDEAEDETEAEDEPEAEAREDGDEAEDEASADGEREPTRIEVPRPVSQAEGERQVPRITVPRPVSEADFDERDEDELDDDEQDVGAPDEADRAVSDGGRDSVDIPIDEDAQQAQPQPQPQRMPRAQTEALTEEDLEELMEPIEDEEEAMAGAAPPQEDEVDFDAQETAQFVPVVIDEADEGGDAAAGEPEGAREARVPTAVTILERRGIGAQDGARDAGDSGELLSDELVQEIEDSTPSGRGEAAQEDESPRGATLLDADQPGEAGETTGDENSARTPDPPPVPGDPPAPKPPPAPAGATSTVQASKGRPSAYGKAWFDEIFDEDYLRTLPFLTPQATQAEARFVADAIAAAPGAQLLDVGCGYGRHAMELAARGYHVVGLDSSLPLLLRGADEAQRRGLTINFVHGDMRELTFESQFDAAYCLFSTFGYFDDETNKKTAQNISRALKPGARFVVEVLNRDYLIQDLPTRVWWEGDGCVVLEEVDFNYFSSRIVSNRSVVFDDGRQLEQEISIRAYSLHELGKLLHAAGFRVLEVSGNMNTRGRFFGAKARDIIVVAEKRGTGG